MIMLPRYQQTVFSEYENLYDRLIPKNHFLRKFCDLVDFSFIYDELEHKYCPDNGRNAVSPIMLFKYLLLKVIYNMSDADLVERSKFDMSFKYFLGLRPEDDVINPSTLTKFRKLRLKDENLLDMLIGKSIEIAMSQGVIKSKRIIVDATHTKARYNQKTAYQCLQEQAKLLRKAIYSFDSPERKKTMPKKVENGIIEDALGYCKKLIDYTETDEILSSIPAVREKLNLLEETVQDHAEHLAASKDTDARVGHKTLAIGRPRRKDTSDRTRSRNRDWRYRILWQEKTLNWQRQKGIPKNHLNLYRNSTQSFRMPGPMKTTMAFSTTKMQICSYALMGIWQSGKPGRAKKGRRPTSVLPIISILKNANTVRVQMVVINQGPRVRPITFL